MTPTTKFPGHAPDGYSLYDAAGSLRYDQTTGNYLRYDAENRLIGVGSNVSYVYNGQGQRVEKNLSGVKTDYLYDLASHVITAFQSAGSWQRGEIYAGGWHLGTYYPNATYFSLTDWLGTEHYRTNNLGNLYQTCYNLPFGDGQTCAGTDVSPLHFTGKERDTESGLDYFGARHFNSSLGRFMIPDWAAKATAVPYADFGDPQSLNLYGYVRSNPLSQVDSDGHAPDIAVIENGPTTSWQDRLETTNGNPVGHTAIAITGKGVYSFGNDAPLGSSASNYVSKQAADRSTTIYIIRTTPEQDDAAAKYLSDKSGQKLGVAIDNCSSRSNGALDAAAIPKLSTPVVIPPTAATPGMVVNVPSATNIPGSAGDRAAAAGATIVTVPQNSTEIPEQLKQFEPK